MVCSKLKLSHIQMTIIKEESYKGQAYKSDVTPTMTAQLSRNNLPEILSREK